MTIFYTYVFVRRDLPMVQQIIQVGHACHEAAALLKTTEAPHICLFEVANEAELLRIRAELKQKRVRFAYFYEPDDGTGFTALASIPVSTQAERELFRGYKPWREKRGFVKKCASILKQAMALFGFRSKSASGTKATPRPPTGSKMS